MNLLRLTAALSLAFLATFTCAQTSPALLAGSAPAAPPRILSLHPLLTELALALADPGVTVTGLVRGGVDPHTFDPSPADARLLARADLILASGLGLETYLDNILAATGARARLFIAGDALGSLLLTHSVAHAHPEAAHAHPQSEPDPHWWHSISATRAVATALAARLAQLTPAEAPAINARLTALLTRLDALAVWAAATAATIPSDRRQLVTTHDAFGYLARDYGFTVRPINGLSTESETSARHFAELATLIRREKIPAIFAELDGNSRLIEQLVRETGVRLGGTLVADGLAHNGPASNYEGMIRQNLTTLATALR